MANYANLKSAIQQVIRTNGNEEITGALLQQTLLTMINSLGAGFQFLGVADTTTNPGTPDQNVFYLAGPGTYTNFNSLTIADGKIGVLKYNGAWSVQTMPVGISGYVKDTDINNQFYYLYIENEQAAKANGLFVYVVEPAYNVVYLGVPGNPTAIQIADIVAGEMRTIENSTYGKISLILKPGYVYARATTQQFNIGDSAFNPILNNILTDIAILQRNINGVLDFVTVSNINDQFIYLNIENKQAAKTNGLFVYVVNPQYNVVYLGVPGNPTAIPIADIVAGQMKVVENATYGKISMIIKPNYVYASAPTQEYNIGEISYFPMFGEILNDIEQLSERIDTVLNFVTETNLNDQFLFLNIENKQAAKTNGLFVYVVEPAYNVVYLGVPGNPTAIQIADIVAGEMRTVENATYGTISLILKPGYVYARSTTETYNIGDVAYFDYFNTLSGNINALAEQLNTALNFVTETNLNNQFVYLYIENRQAAKTNGLFVSVINPEYSVVYLGVPGNITAIQIADIVAGELRTVQNETYGKISLILKPGYIWSRSALDSYNIGDVCYIPTFDYLFELANKLPIVENAETISVPNECLAEYSDFPDLQTMNIPNRVVVNSISDFETEMANNRDCAIVLNTDLVLNKVTGLGTKLIIGNSHKILGYGSSFENGTADNGYLKYPVITEPTKYDLPQPYFADEFFNIHQYYKTDWFDSPGHITKADGTETGPRETGQHRVAVPVNFNFSANEIAGAYIQWFGWFTNWVAKIDSFDGTYLYFTVGNQLPYYNPDGDYTFSGNNTTFRLFNLKNKGYIYFDETYLYVPLSFGKVYLIDFAIDSANNVRIIDSTIIGGINCSGNLELVNCHLFALNNAIFSNGNYFAIVDSIIERTQKAAIECKATYNLVRGCKIFDTCKSRSNIAAINSISSGTSLLCEKNEIFDFGYSAIINGGNDVPASYVPPRAIIQNNIIYQTELYYKNANYYVASDTGAVHLFAWQNKDSIGGLVRNNIIHHFNCRGAGRGIFCDGGCCYCIAYKNDVSNIKTSYCIDMYYATGRTAPTGYIDNNGKIIVGNYVDGPCVLQVGEHSTVKVSIFANNVRIYGNKWETNDKVAKLDNAALANLYKSKKDQFGYVNDGIIISKFRTNE